MGHEVHAVFGQKLLKTQCGVGRCARKPPIIKWANVLSLQKNSLKLRAASHNNASWCIDTDGLLEHSPSRGSLYYKGPGLQKIILGVLGPPHHILPTTVRDYGIFHLFAFIYLLIFLYKSNKHIML